MELSGWVKKVGTKSKPAEFDLIPISDCLPGSDAGVVPQITSCAAPILAAAQLDTSWSSCHPSTFISLLPETEPPSQCQDRFGCPSQPEAAGKSRGTEFDKGGLITRFRKHTSYVIPLTLRALKIVSDLSIAMDSRAFDPYAERTFVRQTSLKSINRILLAIMATMVMAGIGLRIAELGGVGDGTFVGQ